MGLQKFPTKSQIAAEKKSKKTTKSKLDSAVNYQSTNNVQTPKTNLKKPKENLQGKPYYQDILKGSFYKNNPAGKP